MVEGPRILAPRVLFPSCASAVGPTCPICKCHKSESAQEVFDNSLLGFLLGFFVVDVVARIVWFDFSCLITYC